MGIFFCISNSYARARCYFIRVIGNTMIFNPDFISDEIFFIESLINTQCFGQRTGPEEMAVLETGIWRLFSIISFPIRGSIALTNTA